MMVLLLLASYIAQMAADLDVLIREHETVQFSVSRPKPSIVRVIYRTGKRMLIEVDYRDSPPPAQSGDYLRGLTVEEWKLTHGEEP